MKFGLPKNSNLKDMVNGLFAAAGIAVEVAPKRVDYTNIQGQLFQGTACSLKQATLTKWVAEGRLDGGIVGYDYVLEFNEKAQAEGASQVEVIEFFDIAKCELKIAVEEGSDIRNIDDLAGKRIATSYGGILKAFLAVRDIQGCEIVDMEGSVEMAIALGEADAILDVVETGSSLRANNLTPIYNVLSSQAVLIVPERTVRQSKGSNFDGVQSLSNQISMAGAQRRLARA